MEPWRAQDAISGEIHQTYLKFRLACSQGDHGQLRSCLVEVSRGRSTVSSHSTDDREDRRERASTSSTYLARLCLSRHKPPYGGQSSVAVWRVPMAWQIALQWSVITRAQPPGADPHAGWCGRGSGKPDPYPDFFVNTSIAILQLCDFAVRPRRVCADTRDRIEQDLRWQSRSVFDMSGRGRIFARNVTT